MSLKTFMLIVNAHPYCSRNSNHNVTPGHASSACAEEDYTDKTVVLSRKEKKSKREKY